MSNTEKSTTITCKDTNNLVWLDMEMTGLDSTRETILEVAVVITDGDLNVLAETPSYAINQPDSVLQKMDKWNTKTHTKSGLVERVKQSTHTIASVEQEILQFIKTYVAKGQSPLCGNTIYQDRKFVVKYMPKLEEYLHYRNLDVSTLKELAKRWYPLVYTGFTKQHKHEALADILESINELKYYREKMMVTAQDTPMITSSHI
jgi:oligoribonuclease